MIEELKNTYLFSQLNDEQLKVIVEKKSQPKSFLLECLTQATITVDILVFIKKKCNYEKYKYKDFFLFFDQAITTY